MIELKLIFRDDINPWPLVLKEDGYNNVFKYFTFSGGEIHIELPTGIDKNYSDFLVSIDITAKITNSDSLMKLLMITDALRRKYVNPKINVTIPYFPYARQDKIVVEGEALSIKVFTDIINLQNYNTVTTFDLHSDVSKALINNLIERTQKDIFIEIQNQLKMDFSNMYLISPDVGASKKIYGIYEHYSNTSNSFKGVIQANKKRNDTGQIIETEVFFDNFNGEDVIIVDDIVDRGRTFTELAKVLKEKKCGKISLFVTHGIFASGLDVLFDNGIDEIITTDSFYTPNAEDNIKYNYKLKVIKII